MTETTALPAGWGFPTASSRKEHWFAEGELRSGCGRYGRMLRFRTDPDKPTPIQFVCKGCERKCDAAAQTAEVTP